MTEHDEDLADEHPSPRQIRGEQAADERTGGHGDRTGRGNQPVRAGAFRAREVRRDQGHDRGHDQRGADALEERPPEDQHRRFGASAVVNDPHP